MELEQHNDVALNVQVVLQECECRKNTWNVKTSSQIIPIRQIYASHNLKNIPGENLNF